MAKKVKDAGWSFRGFSLAILTILSCGVGLAVSRPLYAEQGWNLSGMGGLGAELSELQEPVVSVVGGTLSYLFKNRWEVGAEFEMTGGVPTIGLDLNFYIEEPFFVGVQAGADIDHSVTPYIGPQIGFDYKISKRWTLGTEVQYLATVNDRGGILEYLGTFKYFF
jgi:hypothetical protein